MLILTSIGLLAGCLLVVCLMLVLFQVICFAFEEFMEMCFLAKIGVIAFLGVLCVLTSIVTNI